MSATQQAGVLGGRALREGLRTPEALAPTLFIPVFFLVVNFGQAGKIFPSDSTRLRPGSVRGSCWRWSSSRTPRTG